jgi:hypothetical protein
MKEFAISSSITSSLFPKLANLLAFPLWFGRTRTLRRTTPSLARFATSITWLGGFMLVSTVVFATAPFIPCHTIPLGDETCLALDCGSGGTTGTRKTFGNSITICLQPLTVKVASYGRNKETVVSFVGSFISSVILIHVMLDSLAILHLFVEERLQHTFIRGLNNTSQHLIPV